MPNGSLYFRLLMLFALTFAGAVHAQGADKSVAKRGRTEIGTTPWSPSARPPGKVTYGTDDRHDVFDESDPARRALADSTCALVDASRLVKNGDGTFSLRPSSYQVFGVPACTDEPFGNQPTAAFCTGFMVGPDLIATAGHCIDESDLSFARFVFGFRIENPTIARTTLDASEVYTGVEIVARKLEGGFDYSIVRVEREITAPGAVVLPLRTAGTIPPGTKIGVIGHPTGLPTKIAFGDDTMVRENTNPGYFVANLDAYGGNSGSPVFNAETGVVEGILVRGESDFEYDGNCFRSRVLDDSEGFGEEVSKASTFARFVQLGRGSLSLDRSSYRCVDTIDVMLSDYDLEGAETAKVKLFTSGSDSETLVLQETGRFGTFRGAIPISVATPVVENGTLEIDEGMSIYVAYRDGNIGNGAPGDALATARVDCTPPVISDVRVTHVGGNRVQVAFSTSEPATSLVVAGVACDSEGISGTGELTTEHLVDVRNLTTLTDYLVHVVATDAAGNSASDDNGGDCYGARTTNQPDFLTEGFFDGTTDLTDLTVTYTPATSTSGYTACTSAARGFPTSPACGEPLILGDDDFVEYTLSNNQQITFFGEKYDGFFVGSNGYITFGEGDLSYEPTYGQHYALPRISGYFSDLYPPQGGVINVAELEDRVAISYYNVYDYYGALQSFQIELFYDGVIRTTWLVQTYPYGIVGLSRGRGYRLDFEASDLSDYLGCDGVPYDDVFCENGIPNDDCDAATSVTLGQHYTGSTAFALGSSDIPGCASCFSQDAWFTFTPATGGIHTLSLCGSQFDTILELYGGTCGDLTFIAGNDDSICGRASEIVTRLSEGVSYRIRVTGYGAAAGTYSFSVTPGGKVFGGCNSGDSTGSPIPDMLMVAGLLSFLFWRMGAREVAPQQTRAE